MSIKKYIIISFLMCLLQCIEATEEELKCIEYGKFETKSYKTWYDFSHGVSTVSRKSGANWHRITIQNSSNGACLSFNYNLYRERGESQIAICLSPSGVEWADSAGELATVPFTNEQIQLQPVKDSINRLPINEVFNIEKQILQRKGKTSVILAVEPEMPIEESWEQLKCIHRAIGGDSYYLMYRTPILFCLTSPSLLITRGNESKIKDDILFLVSLLCLPEEHHNEQTLAKIKELGKKLVQARNKYSVEFARVIKHYGYLLILALYHTQWDFDAMGGV